MKALTLHQPWAWAIVHGGKTVENRSWYHGFTGWLAIHAGKKDDPDAIHFMHRRGLTLPDQSTLQFGAIIGVVNVLGAHHASACLKLNRDYGESPWCSRWAVHDALHWQLTDPRPCKPVAVRGAQGLWQVPEDVVIDLAAPTGGGQ